MMAIIEPVHAPIIKPARQQLPNAFSFDSDAINNVRVMEMARLTGGFMCAAWEVCYAPQCTRFITNDIGRAHLLRPKMSGDSNEMCGVIPMRHDAALVVSYRGTCYAPQATVHDTWAIGPLRRWTLRPDEVDFLNTALAQQAWAEIYGATEAQVLAFHPRMGTSKPNLTWIDPVSWLQTRVRTP